MTEPAPAAEPAPAGAPAAESAPTVEPPLFDRVMLASLVPGLFLPVLAALAAIGGALLREVGGGAEGIWSLVIAVYLFVLLGSMTLNAWLLLRHPRSLLTAALPRRLSIAVAVLHGLLLLWILLLLVGIDALSVVFALALLIESVVVFVLAIRRYLDRGDEPAREEFALPGWGRIVAVVYLALAAAALLFAIASPLIGLGWTDTAGPLGGPATWLLLLLGLPWSHPLYFVSVVLVFNAPAWGGVVPTVLCLLSVIANALLVAQLLSPRRRTMLANWFFRLRPAAEAPLQ